MFESRDPGSRSLRNVDATPAASALLHSASAAPSGKSHRLSFPGCTGRSVEAITPRSGSLSTELSEGGNSAPRGGHPPSMSDVQRCTHRGGSRGGLDPTLTPGRRNGCPVAVQ